MYIDKQYRFFTILVSFCIITLLHSCSTNNEPAGTTIDPNSFTKKDNHFADTNIHQIGGGDSMRAQPTIGTEQLSSVDTGIHTGNVDPAELVSFSQTLLGVPYVWASTDPQVGFDCSGFITYVFSHFNISVPRSSIDFMNVGRTVPVDKAKPGDFILFTGTNPLETDIGHMGLVIANDGEAGLQFIHATSGKAMAVTITKLNEQYMKRFIRISRVFKQNN
ncbi:MAG: C40 family peptidase [Sediminibacterium sp.]